MMTHDYIEHQFCEYMFIQKFFTHRDIEIKNFCRAMGVPSEALMEYLNKEHHTSFKQVVHDCRIEEAKDLWEKAGTTPICGIAHAVGYDNSMAFLLHFLKHEHCLPHVWKRRNLILI